MIASFLVFLEKDVAKHPERNQALDAASVERLKTLVEGVGVDLDKLLSDDDE